MAGARDTAGDVARLTRSITDAKALTMLRDGATVALPTSGDRYTVEHVNRWVGTVTLRRAVPKAKGKAARKAEKRARRAGRFL